MRTQYLILATIAMIASQSEAIHLKALHDLADAGNDAGAATATSADAGNDAGAAGADAGAAGAGAGGDAGAAAGEDGEGKNDGCCGGNDVNIDIKFNVNVAPAKAASDDGADAGANDQATAGSSN